MLFNSYSFLVFFLPVVLAGFYGLAVWWHARAAQLWLICASLFFYGWWDYRFLALLVSSILFNFAVGAKLSGIGRTVQENRRRYWLLVFGIVANLTLIGYFKYAGFLADAISAIGGSDFYLSGIVLPLAISFFTFQQIAFLVDAYRHQAEEFDFQNYVLFVTFFPQLIAGPIVHHKEMMPQFSKMKIGPEFWTSFAVGLSVFIVGLFKKVVLADGFAVYATPVFDQGLTGAPIDFLTAWAGALSYTFQLYFDFSGYSDMAIGLGLMFGIRLPLNFFSPYKSLNIIEFWRRWHMTLSRFLRDYLYFPLGGNRKGKSRRYLNLTLTMLLGGLWHGAGWTFVFWGGLHGLYLVVNHAWHAVKPEALSENSWLRRPVRLLALTITFIAVVVSWVFFRAETFNSALLVLGGMGDIGSVMIPSAFKSYLGEFSNMLGALGVQFGPTGGVEFIQSWLWILIGFLIVFQLPNTWEIFASYLEDGDRTIDLHDGLKNGYFAERLGQWTAGNRWAVGLGLMAVFSVLSLTHVSEFLYFRF